MMIGWTIFLFGWWRRLLPDLTILTHRLSDRVLIDQIGEANVLAQIDGTNLLKHLPESDIAEILASRFPEEKDMEELKKLSDHSIEDVAAYKDLDVISITVLIYSIYKALPCIKGKDNQNLLTDLKNARRHLSNNKFGDYNKSIKHLF